MARQELLFAGPVQLGQDSPQPVEVWVNGTTAVAFAGSDVVGVLQQLQTGFTEDRRLMLSGLTPEGEPAIWQGSDPERVIIRWLGAQIVWPPELGGGSWTGAEVIETQYGVRAAIVGQQPRQLVAARTETTGGQRYIVTGETRILADVPTRKGCGCGGKR